jgi:hypothetical protein
MMTGVLGDCGEEGEDGVGVHDDRADVCTLGQEMGYYGSSKLKPMLVQFVWKFLLRIHILQPVYTAHVLALSTMNTEVLHLQLC